MMTHLALGTGGLAVLSLALAPALANPAPVRGPTLDMKCGPQPEGTTALVAIDGVIQDALPEGDQRPDLAPDADRPLYGGVDREDLFWVQVVCMDPRDSTFHPGGDGIPVASIWTKKGPAGQMPPALAEIVEAQRRHFESHGTYLGDLARIGSFEAPARVEIELESGADWWIATARTERFLGQCTAGGGTSGAPPEPRCGG